MPAITPKQIKSIQHLMHKIDEGNCDYYISLANGLIKSRKTIYYDETTRQFTIYSNGSNLEVIINHKDILSTKKSNIGKAIKVGALYMYNK